MWPTVDRCVCLLVDKRDDQVGRLMASLGRYFPLTFFRCGDGQQGGRYDHVDVEPPRGRSGYPAWVVRPNSYNAFLCFRKIVQRAMDDGVETLLLFEDDAAAEPCLPLVFPRAWAELHTADPLWESLYLGANHAFKPTQEVPGAPHLLRLNGSGCWHAVILHSRVFGRVLSLPMSGPIDGVFGDTVHPAGHSYAAWPQCVWPTPGFSLCEGVEVDYSHFKDVRA